MRKVIIMFALAMGIITANAQENVTVETTNGSEQPTLTKEVYPQKEADGDLYHGLSRKLTFDRMIPPHGLEVTYDKTVHVIFPAEVRYVDLGSPDLIAGKADGAENIIRVKATVRNFPNETNMSVITEDGSFYTFNVKYAAEPLLLNVEMCDFIHDGSTVNRPNNAQEIYLKELGSESPMLVRLIMKSIHKQNKREVKHIGCKRFGIQYLLKGIYTHNGLLYFHTEIKNQSNVPFDVDYITWKIVDKKVAKRTAVQEQIILPLRAQNYATLVPGKKSERTVFTMAKFTIPDDKCLVVELNEKNGGRHQSFVIENVWYARVPSTNFKYADHEKVHRNNHRVACPFYRAGARPAVSAEDAGHRGEGGHGGRLQSRRQGRRVQLRGGSLHLHEEGEQVGVRWRIPVEEQSLQGHQDTRGAVHGGGRLLLQDTVGRPKDCFRLCRGFGSRRI